MALIGPRPLWPKYLPLYSPEQMRRHEVRPGISGWAQCHGRNAISWAEKFKLDVWYVDHLSLWNDIKVFQDTRQHPYIWEMGYEDSVHIFMQMRKDNDGAIIDHYFKKYDFDAIVTNQELDITWYLKQNPSYIRIIDGENCDLWIKV